VLDAGRGDQVLVAHAAIQQAQADPDHGSVLNEDAPNTTPRSLATSPALLFQVQREFLVAERQVALTDGPPLMQIKARSPRRRRMALHDMVSIFTR
jgi:hypothetical protein